MIDSVFWQELIHDSVPEGDHLASVGAICFGNVYRAYPLSMYQDQIPDREVFLDWVRLSVERHRDWLDKYDAESFLRDGNQAILLFSQEIYYQDRTWKVCMLLVRHQGIRYFINTNGNIPPLFPESAIYYKNVRLAGQRVSDAEQ